MPVTRCATTLVAVILVVCVTTAWQADPVFDWIRGNAIPLSTPEAGQPVRGSITWP